MLKYETHHGLTGRFVNNARVALGERVYDELNQFNYQLGLLLAAKYPSLRKKDPAFRSATTRLFKTMVPLHRNMDKLLHQREADKTFLPMLETLACALVLEVTQRTYWASKSLEAVKEVGDLPISGALLAHLTFERTGCAPDWLPHHVKNQAWATQALRQIQGNTIAELAQDYKSRSRDAYSEKQTRVQTLLGKVHETLGVEDYDYLRRNLELRELQVFMPSTT